MKTKNRRLLLIFSIICIIVFLSIFSSQVFKLKTVEIIFFDDEETRVVNIKNNSVFNTNEKINSILSTTKFDYGNLVFLIDKSSYISSLEQKNPYLKLKKIEIKFPNKLLVSACERRPVFYIQSADKIYLLDNDFKLLEIKSKLQINTSKLTQILVVTELEENRDFFSFFNVLPEVYEAGQNLKENNMVLDCISNMPTILDNYLSSSVNIANFCSNIIIKEKGVDTINLKITTSLRSYGISLVIENIFNNFDRKLNKLINAFNTLKRTEPIKTTYGELLVDENINCYWNNL